MNRVGGAHVCSRSPKERIRCRTGVATGSLARRERRCGTLASWRKSEDAARDEMLANAIPGFMKGDKIDNPANTRPGRRSASTTRIDEVIMPLASRVAVFAVAAVSTAVFADPQAAPVQPSGTAAISGDAAPAGTSPSPVPAQVAAVAPKKPRIICKTDPQIGSLIMKSRRCGAEANWRKSEDAARAQTIEMATPGLLTGN